jgi:hypothetical protein
MAEIFRECEKSFQLTDVYTNVVLCRLRNVCSSPGRQVTVAAELYTTSLNICGSSEYNLLQISLLAARTFDVTPRFYQNLYILALYVLFIVL